MRTLLTILILAACGAQAQTAEHAYRGSVLDTVRLPGDFASTNGNVSSYEKGNVVSDNYFEQRAVIFSALHDSLTVTPYASLEFLLDTYGYNWNNKVIPGMGIRLNQHLARGIVSAGAGYVYEDRFRNVQDFRPTGGRTDYISTWFGWSDVSDRHNRFPGSAWGMAGHFSPIEHGNLIERAHAQQGYVLKWFNKAALVPYVEGTVGHDSQHLNWENIAIFGTGVKAVLVEGPSYTDFGIGYLRESRYVQSRTVNGVKVFVDVYYSWKLFGRR